jgi:hypothetical protein
MDIPILNVILQHTVLAVVPGVIGATVGIFFGQTLHNRLMSSNDPSQSSGFVFWFPWRGLSVALLVFILFNVYPVLWFGLGSLAAAMMVFLASVTLATTITFSIEPGNQAVTWSSDRMLSTARTVVVSAVGFAVFGSDFGSATAGTLIREGFLQSNIEFLWLGYGIVAAIAVSVDLVSAVVAKLLSRSNSRRT